jgi:hypothetical protein
MSVKYIIAHEHHEVLNADYFVEQLRKKWPEVKIHFITDPNAPLLQFETSDDFWILGNFTGTGVAYQVNSSPNAAQFALWYRSIVPAEWQLRYHDSGLYFDLMFLTSETTEEQIIAGFNIPFDISKYE